MGKLKREIETTKHTRFIFVCFVIFAYAFISLRFAQSVVSVAQSPPSATKRWSKSTPEEQGVDSAQLAEAIETARSKGLAIHSLLIVRNGYLVAESYFFPYDGKQPHDVASIGKSVTTTLAGIAIGQGKIKSAAELALSFFSNRTIANRDERKERIKLSDLMTMSSGLNCISKGGEPTLWEMLKSPDNVQHMLDLKMVADPGANFVYCSGGMHLMSAIIARSTGLSTETFARKTLFEPLGIHNLIWPADPQGVNHGFGNLHLLPADMAKLGWLFLNHGKWDGRQIVPADWVAAATRFQKSTGNPRDYGFGWWIPKSDPLIAYEASGRGGQQISVLPAKKTVIVFTGGGFPTGEVMKLVTPALKDGPLPPNPQGVARLNAAIAAAAKPPATKVKATLPSIAQNISGKMIQLDQNWMGLDRLTLSFLPGGQTTGNFLLGWSLKQAQFGASAKIKNKAPFTEIRPVGVNGVPLISPNGVMGLPVAISGIWEDNRTFMFEYDEIANTNAYRFRLQFEKEDGGAISIQAKERTGLFEQNFSGRISAPMKKSKPYN
jgi:CubicO group peptidase (beta-lactamase class C family)